TSVTVDKEAIGQWVFESIEMDINSDEDVKRFIQQLQDYPDKHRTVIKYGLRGTINLAAQTTLDSEIEKLEPVFASRSEEHTSELQSRFDLVCRLLLEKKN